MPVSQSENCVNAQHSKSVTVATCVALLLTTATYSQDEAPPAGTSLSLGALPGEEPDASEIYLEQPGTALTLTPPVDYRFGEEDPVGSFFDNARRTVDISTRQIFNDRTGQSSHANFIGFDMHKVFTSDEGDIGTLVLQPYLTRLDNVGAPPPFFDDGDDWELVYRIFNFNYTALAGNKFNVRVGHMEVPFGLEHVINTNGTLLDYIHGPNIGVKADWAVAINGELENWEYEVALLRGSGNEWIRRGDPYIVAGRVGTSRDEPFALGASFYHGEVFRYPTPDDPLRRSRLGIDMISYWECLTFLGEVSVGYDQDTPICNAILELDVHSTDGTLMLFNQVISLNADVAGNWTSTTRNFLGARWAPDSHWALSAMWRQDLVTRGGAPDVGLFFVQVRYRF